MTSLNLEDSKLRKEWRLLQEGKVDWLLCHCSPAAKSVLLLYRSGSGSVDVLKSHLRDSMCCFGVFSMYVAKCRKLIFVTWIGGEVASFVRASVSMHKSAVAAYFDGVVAAMHCFGIEDLSRELVVSELIKLGHSEISFELNDALLNLTDAPAKKSNYYLCPTSTLQHTQLELQVDQALTACSQAVQDEVRQLLLHDAMREEFVFVVNEVNWIEYATSGRVAYIAEETSGDREIIHIPRLSQCLVLRGCLENDCWTKMFVYFQGDLLLGKLLDAADHISTDRPDAWSTRLCLVSCAIEMCNYYLQPSATSSDGVAESGKRGTSGRNPHVRPSGYVSSSDDDTEDATTGEERIVSMNGALPAQHVSAKQLMQTIKANPSSSPTNAASPFHKYECMLRYGCTQLAVAHCMRRDGLNDDMIAAVVPEVMSQLQSPGNSPMGPSYNGEDSNDVTALNAVLLQERKKQSGQIKGVFWTPPAIALDVAHPHCSKSVFDEFTATLPNLSELTNSLSESFTRQEKIATPKPKVVSRPKELISMNQRKWNNVAIKLKQLRATNEEIINHVHCINIVWLTSDKASLLLQCLPTEQQLKFVERYAAHYERLGYVEKFFHDIRHVPLYKEKLHAVLAYHDIRESLASVLSQLEKVSNALQELLGCVSLQKVLHVVLAAGNYMNIGTAREGFGSFDIRFLKNLLYIRSTDQKSNFLEVIVSYMIKQFPRLANIHSHLSRITAAKNISLREVDVAISNISLRFTAIKTVLDHECSNTNCEQLSAFYNEFRVYANGLRTRYNALAIVSDRTLQFFGLGLVPSSGLQSLWSILLDFMVDYKTCYSEMLDREAKHRHSMFEQALKMRNGANDRANHQSPHRSSSRVVLPRRILRPLKKPIDTAPSGAVSVLSELETVFARRRSRANQSHHSILNDMPPPSAPVFSKQLSFTLKKTKLASTSDGMVVNVLDDAAFIREFGVNMSIDFCSAWIAFYDDVDTANWIILHVENVHNEPHVILDGTGNGGLCEMNKRWMTKAAQVGCMRIIGVDEFSRRCKLIMVMYISRSAPVTTRTYLIQNKDYVKRFFPGVHVEISIEDESELTEDVICQRLLAAAGAHAPTKYIFNGVS